MSNEVTGNGRLATAAAIAILGACGGARGGGDCGGRVPVGAEQAERDLSPSGAGIDAENSRWTPGILCWAEENFRQTLYASAFRYVTVVDEALDAQSGEWMRRAHSGSSSFDILRFGWARKDLYCVAGLSANGDFVLERWRLRPKSFTGINPSGAAPSGGGSPVTPTLVPKEFTKTEIFRGPLAEAVYGVTFDYEGRYICALLELSGVRTLYRFTNTQNASPEVVLDATAVPEINDMTSLDRAHNSLLGRVLVMDKDIYSSLRILVVDTDNDGEFDGSPLVGDLAYFESLGVQDYELWSPLIGP